MFIWIKDRGSAAKGQRTIDLNASSLSYVTSDRWCFVF